MMSTYFHGGSDQIQSGNENLQTLYLMNPNYITPYTSDAPNSNPNMLLFNPSVSNQQFFGIPLTGGGGPHSQVYYNPWNQTGEPEQSPVGGPMGFRRPNTGELSLSLSHNNNSGVQGVMVGSKYLKAAQELLDEVVNVVGRYTSGAHKEKRKGCVVNKEAVVGGGGREKAAEELISSGQREELQMKKAKLLTMLDEVEERHRQYQTQTHVLVSSFEQITGTDSAKSYTSLALHTISKQFKCLKYAIMSQIKATSTSLGEDHESNVSGSSKLEGGGDVGSRLRFVDHQLRQQRALQQLGMMQHNAWRPQRGLPERAVSVLRAWLFEHFLHPYPKDSDKQLLAKQTGLTRSQVSNWFINARVRLWKPMVEEMYLEEVKTQEQKNPNSESKTNNTTNIGGPSTVNDPNNGGADAESLIARNPKKQQSMQSSPSSILSMDVDQRQSLSTSPMIINGHHHQGFNSNNPYFVNNDMMGRFNPDHQFTAHQYHGNNNGTVSLTLGLPHREDQSELCGISMGIGQSSNPINGYESINIPSRKRFVAHQLMHDFVA